MKFEINIKVNNINAKVGNKEARIGDVEDIIHRTVTHWEFSIQKEMYEREGEEVRAVITIEGDETKVVRANSEIHRNLAIYYFDVEMNSEDIKRYVVEQFEKGATVI